MLNFEHLKSIAANGFFVPGIITQGKFTQVPIQQPMDSQHMDQYARGKFMTCL